ncbi:aminotriazole resistance protein [Ustulina deusta]|nr:aminotriazole resistance protein [Ustulina deusta]KAI3327459.1 aminotriazole resistance protein [Ustulina deusta]
MATDSLNTAASIATLIVVCLVFFIDIANLGMANIALPTIQKAFGYDDGTLQWVLTAYSLAFGGLLMAGGRLGDIFGHRNVLIFGMTLFNIATLICALVRNQIGFLIGRAFQGVAAAFTIPSAQSLVALSFDDPQSRIKAFAAWGACGSSGFVFGPIIGGLLTSLVSWEWIFWVSLIVEGALEISALALLVTNNIPGATSPSEKGDSKWAGLHIRLDVLGTALSVPALVLLVFGLTTGNIVGWNQAEVIATIVTAVVLLASFAFVEAKVSSDPILPEYIWGDRIRILGCVVAALTYGAWQGCNYLLTLQLQSFGFSALETSLRFLPLGITALVVNFLIPLLLKPIGARILLIGSWLIALVGIILFTRMNSADDYWRYCLPGMILYIAGVGTVYFVGNVTVVATASEQRQGTVSGVYNMFLNVGGAVLGVAVLTVINDSVTSNNGGKGSPDATLDGYRAGYYGAIAMAAIGLICSIFFTQPKKDEGKSQSEHPECPNNNSQQPSSGGPSEEEHPQKTLSVM